MALPDVMEVFLAGQPRPAQELDFDQGEYAAIRQSARMDANLIPFALQDLPRYTSYPTAVQFGHLEPATADRWLTGLSDGASLSVYVHIPFCRQLCWYCGCHTSVPNSYERAERYVDLLVRDIRRSAAMLNGPRGRVRHLHFGGGTPTYLADRDIARIVDAVADGFGLEASAEVALESDPRTLTAERAQTLAGFGFNRVSFGVQDFATPVQMKINRLQTYGLVAAATSYLRNAGFQRVNFDLMYGLPSQTEASVSKTAEQAATLAPDRIAVFGYAHVPWFKKHQRMIRDEDLPGVSQRYAQAMEIGTVLTGAGYSAIGLDHYALPHDELSRASKEGKLRRNFQGYTTDAAEALISFGASAISEYPQGFAQAARDTLAWSEAIERGENPTARGVTRGGEDRMRAEIIERLMCDLSVDYASIAKRHGCLEDQVGDVRERLSAAIAAGIVTVEQGRISVPSRHRLFLRTAASVFDTHYVAAPNRHAKAI